MFGILQSYFNRNTNNANCQWVKASLDLGGQPCVMLPPVQVGLQAPGGAPALSQARSVPPCMETQRLHPSSLHCNAGDVITISLCGLEISCVMSAESFLIKIKGLLLLLSHSSFFRLVFCHSHFQFLPFRTLVQVHEDFVATCPFSTSHVTTSPLLQSTCCSSRSLLVCSPPFPGHCPFVGDSSG